MASKNHQNWSWILMLTFIIAGIIDYRLGLLGVLCMITPIYHAFRGRGKIHCSHYCPRGSLLKKALTPLSAGNKLPNFVKTKKFKSFLLLVMMGAFTISLIHSGGDIKEIGFAIFRLMTVSLAVGILTGMIFNPRSWCVVCPMGYGTELIRDWQKKK